MENGESKREQTKEEIERYVATKATRQEWDDFLTWWLEKGFDEFVLRQWLFLRSGGYPLFGRALDLTHVLESLLGLSINLVEEMNRRADEAAERIDKASVDDYPESLEEPTLDIDVIPHTVYRGDVVISLDKFSDFYQDFNDVGIHSSEALAIASAWAVPYVEPASSRQGPSGAPLSFSYYEALKEYAGVTTHLFTTLLHSYYPNFVAQWPIAGETMGAIGPIYNLEKALEDGSYELNLLGLGPYGFIFLNYVLERVIPWNGNIRLFVVREYDTHDFDAAFSERVGDRLFEIYTTSSETLPSTQQLKTLMLMLGKPRERRTLGIPFVSDFERTVLVGTRAEQIARGSTPHVDVEPTEIDPFPIAAREFLHRRLGLEIVRRFPNGDIERLDPDAPHVESHASLLDPLI